jgi:hypothetical protein
MTDVHVKIELIYFLEFLLWLFIYLFIYFTE